MADNFYYGHGSILSVNLLKTLAKELTVNPKEDYRWTLEYPTDISTIGNMIMLSTTFSDGTNNYTKYLKLSKPPITTLNSNQQKLVNKYNYQGAFSGTEISNLQKYYGSQSFPTSPVNEKDFLINWYNNIKGHSSALTNQDLIISNTDPAGQRIMNIITNVRNFNDVQELYLYAKEQAGVTLSTDEQTKLNVYKEKRTLTSDELYKAQQIFTVRELSEDLGKLVVLDYYGLASDTTSSIGLDTKDTTLLDNYRTSRIVSPEEMTQVLQIIATLNINNALIFQIGGAIDENKTDFSGTASLPAKFTWFKKVHSNLADYTGCDYWLNLSKECFNLVVRGDASTDIYPYTNWLLSYAFVERLTSIDETEFTPDYDGNWGMSVSSDIQPDWNIDTSTEHLGVEGETYGFRTANGITDITMEKTKSGMPYQPHYPKFATTNPQMDIVNTEGSRWNKNKHSFDEILVLHPFDMERGKLQNVLIGDSSAKFDCDRLLYSKPGEDPEVYLKFKITAPYNFLNNSANPGYCIALRIGAGEVFNETYYENYQYAVTHGYIDVTPPTISDTTITTSNITSTGVTLGWTKANDTVSAQNTLQYLVYRSGTNNIDTLANTESNGIPIGAYQTDINALNVTGLTANTAYYFNIIVKDQNGNKTAYTTKTITTLS